MKGKLVLAIADGTVSVDGNDLSLPAKNAKK
jgi:hypothetical protein